MLTLDKWKHKFELKPNCWVFVPTSESVEYGKSVKENLESHWKSPRYYYHLRDGGHVKALCSHLGSTHFVHLDIQDFFGCVNRSRVTRCLKRFHSYKDARDIATFSTVRIHDKGENKYALPFGFVQSPILASICLRQSKLGGVLHALSKQKEISISVYMDDIILSSSDIDGLNYALGLVKESAIRSRFPLNLEKEEGPCKKITAFNIEISKGLLKITNSRLSRFVKSYEIADNEYKREGIIGYVSSINKDQSEVICQ